MAVAPSKRDAYGGVGVKFISRDGFIIEIRYQKSDFLVVRIQISVDRVGGFIFCVIKQRTCYI